MLYIVSTPIGNMGDITKRAIETLSTVEYVLAEDTRTTGKLLKYNNIPKKHFINYNDYNAKKRIPKIIELLKEGHHTALVSENGTPCVSDPGYKLIRECIKENIEVTPIPGPSAFLAALTVSGFPTDKFTFYGFFPKTKKKKLDLITKSKQGGMTAIFYESPHRIIKTLEILKDNYPDDNIFIARELTKRYEEFYRGNPKEIIEKLKPKGEFTIIM
ncbi:MAG: 16S rRNA (cytidine(1402)-2'-O)-methyltransferase [Nanobdellota archaeon]